MANAGSGTMNAAVNKLNSFVNNFGGTKNFGNKNLGFGNNKNLGFGNNKSLGFGNNKNLGFGNNKNLGFVGGTTSKFKQFFGKYKIIVIGAVLVLLGVAAYFLFFRKSKDPEPTTNPPVVVVPVSAQPVPTVTTMLPTSPAPRFTIPPSLTAKPLIVVSPSVVSPTPCPSPCPPPSRPTQRPKIQRKVTNRSGFIVTLSPPP